MAYSSLWLSQIHFLASLGFMALFLGASLGLAWLLAYFRLRSLRADGAGWLAAYRFWVRVFALALALGMTSGIAVLIQAGSLWPGLFVKAGDVIGPLLAAALVCGFIFKSCFLGAMLFAERRLTDRAHALMALMVAVGLTLTLFWLVALVSWMQTPAGVWVFDDKYGVRDWAAVVFNPSFPWYAGLYLAACLACVAFLVLAVTAWQSLWHPLGDGERHAFRTSMVLGGASLVVLVCMAIGAGQMTARLLPAKAAATAGYWHSGSPPDLVLFALPSEAAGGNRASLHWPRAGGRWLGKNEEGELRGLDQFAGMSPPVAATFLSFRLAVLAGALMAVCLAATAVRLRGQADPSGLPRWWKRWLVSMGIGGSLLMLAGVTYVMVGAHPYAITGAVTLQEAAAVIEPGELFLGMLAYLAVYGICIAAFIGLVGHAARYGVVPVARHRGRA
ncbi:cytochrome ubiquinol oxidase subunit I [Paracandidimonas soli]|uniref:cytochrome ubiquinol oxidase subunit I n=1 Tax=Paracandidimonas soli TaxID=1917182 RepID=UPI003341377C